MRTVSGRRSTSSALGNQLANRAIDRFLVQRIEVHVCTLVAFVQLETLEGPSAVRRSPCEHHAHNLFRR
jgi:hypothetical protein